MGKHRTSRFQVKEAGLREGKNARKPVVEVVIGARESLFQPSIDTLPRRPALLGAAGRGIGLSPGSDRIRRSTCGRRGGPIE